MFRSADDGEPIKIESEILALLGQPPQCIVIAFQFESFDVSVHHRQVDPRSGVRHQKFVYKDVFSIL